MHEISMRQGPRTGSFEFDEADLRLLSKSIVNTINKRFDDNKKINGTKKLKFKSPIDGKFYELNFRLEQVLNPEEFFKGPKASWRHKIKEITFYIPDEFVWHSVPSNQWENQFYSNFIHELTHAFDEKGNAAARIADEKDKAVSQPTSFGGSDAEYFQDPAEVKAHLTQIANEILEGIRTSTPEELNNITRPEQLLELSYTWGIAHEFWKNHPNIIKLVMKSAFDIFQNLHHQSSR